MNLITKRNTPLPKEVKEIYFIGCSFLMSSLETGSNFDNATHEQLTLKN